MNSRLPRFEATRHSGIPWLGTIPEHWKVQRGKTFLSTLNVRSDTGQEELLTVSSRHGVVPRSATSVTMFKASSYVGHKLCWPGDLVINSLWAWSRGLGVSRHYGIVSTAYGVYRPKDPTRVHSDYLHHLVRSTPFNWELRVRSKGIWTSRLQLTDDAFLDAPFPLPPPPEQTAIVRFLDYVDRSIRRYIRAKEKLVALLEKQKQGVIHQVVTGQIDVRTGRPYAAYKDSGVERLDGVPGHWDVRRLKTLCRMKSGESITARSLDLDGEYPVYGGNGLRGYTSMFTHDGDFLLVGRQGALCGNVHVVGGRFWASEHAVVVTPRHGQVLRWLGALLEAMNLNQYSIAAAQPGLAVDRVLNLWAPVPPQTEQKEIAVKLDELKARTCRAIAVAQEQLALARKYSSRLIADVVTGKLDVREAAAALHDLDRLEVDTDEDEATGRRSTAPGTLDDLHDAADT